MTTHDDIDKFKEMLAATNKKYFSELNQEKLTVLPNIWTTFTTPGTNLTRLERIRACQCWSTDMLYASTVYKHINAAMLPG